MTETDRQHMVTNVVNHASQGDRPEMQDRVIEYWRQVDPELGARVAKGLQKERPSPSARG